MAFFKYFFFRFHETFDVLTILEKTKKNLENIIQEASKMASIHLNRIETGCVFSDLMLSIDPTNSVIKDCTVFFKVLSLHLVTTIENIEFSLQTTNEVFFFFF